MTYTENVTAMAADWMAGALSGDGPDALSPMVVTALPDPALPETGKRVIAAGRQAVASALARDALGRGRRESVFCCARRDRAAIEFAETSPDGSRRSSIVTMQLAAGSITRIVAFRHAYVPRLAGPAAAAGTPADAAQLLVRRYLDDLEAGRATEAAGPGGFSDTAGGAQAETDVANLRRTRPGEQEPGERGHDRADPPVGLSGGADPGGC